MESATDNKTQSYWFATKTLGVLFTFLVKDMKHLAEDVSDDYYGAIIKTSINNQSTNKFYRAILESTL